MMCFSLLICPSVCLREREVGSKRERLRMCCRLAPGVRRDSTRWKHLYSLSKSLCFTFLLSVSSAALSFFLFFLLYGSMSSFWLCPCRSVAPCCVSETQFSISKYLNATVTSLLRTSAFSNNLKTVKQSNSHCPPHYTPESTERQFNQSADSSCWSTATSICQRSSVIL